MSSVRITLVSLAAALAGCAAGSILIFGELGRTSLIALPFTCMGSLLLIAPLYAAARESGVAVGLRYARLLMAGTLAGGLMLGFVCMTTDPLGGAAMGSAYGALTAACWIALHASTKRPTDLMP